MGRVTRARAVIWAAIALMAPLFLASCSPVSQTAPIQRDTSSAVVDCQGLLRSVVARDRTGDTSHATNGEMDTLRLNCSSEYAIVTDYFQIVIDTAQFGPGSCERWRHYNIRPEAIELLQEDGLCFTSGGAATTELYLPDGALSWDQADAHAGTNQYVCGPKVSIRGNDQGVFVNIGKDYPSPDRFAFVLWGDWWLESIADGSTVCASGEVYLYEGVAQMEFYSPSDLEIWE